MWVSEVHSSVWNRFINHLVAMDLVGSEVRTNLGEDEPDVFYDCFDEDYDESLQSVANNFYKHVGDCEVDHEHDTVLERVQQSGQLGHDNS